MQNSNPGLRMINIELMALSSMWKWAYAYERGYTAEPPLKIQMMRYKRPLPETLSQRECIAILDAFEEPFHKAMFSCMYYAGLRSDEVFGLLRRNVSDRHIRVTGKGSKERIVPMSGDLKRYMSDHLFWMCVQGVKSEFVFPSLRGSIDGKMTDCRKPLRSACKAVGITKPVRPHMFRHAFATHLLERGGGLREIQQLLGHEQVTTTEIYTHVAMATLEKTVNILNPVGLKRTRK
jgi:integrase/recombinase XerD